MTAIGMPQCPTWCRVSIAEHLRDDDPEEGGFLHYRHEEQANHYARNHPDWAPKLSVAVDQDHVSRSWIQLECSTYLTPTEARTLAASLVASADTLEQHETSRQPV